MTLMTKQNWSETPKPMAIIVDQISDAERAKAQFNESGGFQQRRSSIFRFLTTLFMDARRHVWRLF